MMIPAAIKIHRLLSDRPFVIAGALVRSRRPLLACRVTPNHMARVAAGTAGVDLHHVAQLATAINSMLGHHEIW